MGRFGPQSKGLSRIAVILLWPKRSVKLLRSRRDVMLLRSQRMHASERFPAHTRRLVHVCVFSRSKFKAEEWLAGLNQPLLLFSRSKFKADEWLAGLNQHSVLFSRSKFKAEEWLAGLNQSLLLFSQSKFKAEEWLAGLNQHSVLFSRSKFKAEEWLAGLNQPLLLFSRTEVKVKAEEWLAGLNQHSVLFSRSKFKAEEWLAGLNQPLLLFSRSKFKADEWLAGLNQHSVLFSRSKFKAEEWLAGLNQPLLLFSQSKVKAEEWLAGLNQHSVLFSRSKFKAEEWLAGLNQPLLLFSRTEVKFKAEEWLVGLDHLFFLFSRSVLDLDGHEKIMRKATTSVKKYQDPLIDERIKQWNDGTKTEKEDILDIVIMLKQTDGTPLLSREEIKAQIVELMIATVDNPSNGVEWALAEMLNQPETLERATAELYRVVGKERLVQESDISQLNYVKSCVKEAFRLHPIAPFNVPHVSISDTTVGNYFIPKGSHVLLSRPGLGRNPRIWNESLKFKPERHLKDDGSEVLITDPDLRMLSFSTGRRGCAGVTLGSTMTSMLMARLLQGFTWNLPPTASHIDLKESPGDLLLAKPLFALAKPRLAENLYSISL
ncbi:hypothetical protein ACSBR1_033092 [Camellia fascicularis]